MQRRQPPPPQTPIAGSLIAVHTPPGTQYHGRWDSGFDYFDMWFHYHASDATAWARAYWSAGPTSDHGVFAQRPLKLPPNLLYRVAEIQADNWDWWCRLLVTS